MVGGPVDRANVDTDAIIPKQVVASTEGSGFGPSLLNAHDDIGLALRHPDGIRAFETRRRREAVADRLMVLRFTAARIRNRLEPRN